MSKEQAKIVERFKGTVVSAAMDKTIVVSVDTLKTHSKYHKKYIASKKYKVHDPENTYAVGDTVEFVPCRPLSKDKRFTVVTQ